MKLQRPFIIYLILLAAAFTAVGCSGKKTDTTNEEVVNTADGGNISETSTNSANPKISADKDGNVYLTWEETSSDNAHTEIYLARSTNSGNSFIKSNLNKGSHCTVSGHASAVSAASGGNGSFNALWTDGSKIKYYNDETNTCKSVSSVSKDASSPVINYFGNGKLQIVWEEDMGSQKRDIFFRNSDNGGTDFNPSIDSDPMNISNSASDSSDPMLGVMEGSLTSNIDIVWVEGAEGSRNISIATSTDSGVNFIPQTVADSLTDSYCPVMNVTASGTIYLVFKGDSGIYFARRQSSASSFSAPIKISPNSSSPSCPEMSVGSNGVIYAVWSDSGEIWAAISADAGHSFTYPKNTSSTTGTSSSPKMAMDGNYINLVWIEEDIGKGDIYFSGSNDNGKNFSSPVNLSDSSDTSGSPVIAADGKDYIYIAWVEGDDNSGDIYFVRDKGARGLTNNAQKSLSKFLDINGDGKSDIVIGAPSKKDGNVIGKVYVYYGSDNLTGSADLTLSEASAGDQFGFSVAIAGDINGDGYADIIAGAPYNDDNAANSGVVYIYYGNQSSLMDNTPDVTIKGLEDNDYAGYAVSSAGDLNKDGYDDVIIGLPGSHGAIPYSGTAVIFFGGPNLGSKINFPALNIDDADIVLNGENGHDKFGSAVSMAGDFNNDGIDDVAVSAPFAGDSLSKKGRVYIYFGGSKMNSKADVQITGESNIDKIGISLSGGSDINGDGKSDLIIGAPDADLVSEAINDAGKVYIVYGFDSSDDDELTLIDLGNTTYAVTVLKGEKYKEFFGSSVGNSGDFNGDTYTDVIVGSAYVGTDSSYKDNARLYYGGPAMDSTVDVTFTDNKHEDGFGASVAGAGDVDGDGYYDVLVGAYFADGDGTDRGRVHLYRGNTIPDIDADAAFAGTIDNGWAGYSLYRIQQ